MRKAKVQLTLNKGPEEKGSSMAPPSPQIPSKHARGSPDEAAPEPRSSPYPTPTPPVFIRKMRNAAVGTGCDVRLKVAVAGNPQPSLYWYHNDELLDTIDQEYGALWVRDCHASDNGLYTCVANNQLGEARSSAILAVLDLGEDSETTEDETTEAHILMEAKGEVGGQAKRAPRRGEGVRSVLAESGPSRGIRTDGCSPSRDNVVEKEEAPALGSRAPGLQDPLRAGRQAKPQEVPGGHVRHLGVEPLIRASRANLACPVWGSEESVSVASDHYSSTFSLYRGRTFSVPLYDR